MFDDFSYCFGSQLPRLACGLAIILGVSATAHAGPAHAGPIDLTPAASDETQQVKVAFEVTGKLLSVDRHHAKPQEHPLKALGSFLYEERMLDHKNGRSIRYYERAESNFEVDGRSQASAIRDDLRWIIVNPDELEDMYVCPTGALSRQELELIEFPGSSNLIDRLLPEGEKSVGDTWQHADTLLAQILNLDAVTANDVQSKLIKVEDGTAYLSLMGKILGSVEGVVTEINLNGKYNFDVQSATINWAAFAIEEQREIGASTPGLKVTARLRMVKAAVAQPKFVDPQSIAQFDLNSVLQGTLLEHRTEAAGFAIVHNRRWHLFTERPSMTVLRCVDDGRMIAQCNISCLPPIDAEKPLTMQKFQQDIRLALGESVNQIVDATQSTNSKGQEVLRVVAAGTVAESPILWIYYHITHTDGRRISCAFTMAATDAEQFGGEDLALTGGIMFLDPPEEDSGADTTAARNEAETVR